MSDMHTAEHARAVTQHRSDRLFDLYRTGVYLYGAFVLGFSPARCGLAPTKC